MTPIVHPAFGLDPVNYSAVEMSDDPDTQVAQTIELMCQYVREDAQKDCIKRDAQEALLYPAPDPLSVLVAVFRYVKGSMSFRLDDDTASVISPSIPGSNTKPIVEVLIRPCDLSRMRRESMTPIGDCDDYSMYVAALLTCLGIDCSFVTLAADDRDPSCYSHVYTVAYVNGQRIALDCSHGSGVGWEAPNKFGKRREWPVSQGGTGTLVAVALGAAAIFFIARFFSNAN